MNTEQNSRVDFVDALRGFALTGVFGANLLVFSGYIFMTDGQKALLPTASMDKIIYLFELIFWLASVWLRHFRFGPAEWFWRSLTYWKRQSLRVEAATAT